MPNSQEKLPNSELSLKNWWPLRTDRISCCQVRGCNKKSDGIRLVMPGSFNPLHQAHLAMADHASQVAGTCCFFELSLANVDKPQLELAQIERRIDQPFGSHGLLISNATRFDEKSKIFPEATFVVGSDTLFRLDHASYYGDSEKKRDESIKKITDNGCRFLVFGRLMSNKFVDSENIEIDEKLRSICEFVPRSAFEMNISSTQLRDGGSQQPGKD